VLHDAPLATRLLFRRIGAVALVLGIVGVALLMFVFTGTARPWHLAVACVLGGAGVVLLRVPGRAGPVRVEGVDRPVLLFSGIFATFGTLGVLFLMVFFNPERPAPPQAGLLAAAISGLIACGWAASFTYRAWWLIPIVIVFQVFAPARLFELSARFGLLHDFLGQTPQQRMGLLGFQALACVVIGYVLIVKYVREIERTGTRARVELEVARKVHETLVPPVDLRTPGLIVHARSEASSEMGGDLVDAVASPAHTDVFLADVSGHGVGAGIVMGMVKSAIRARLRTGAPLEELLADLNAVLTDLTAPHMFATFAAIRLSRGSAQFALAGHLPIYLRRANGEVIELANDSLPLGLESGERFGIGSVVTAPGDTFVVFTDGLVEVQNRDGRDLGLAPLREVIARQGGSSPDALREALLARARGHGPQTDDQSVLVVRVVEPGA
jgi:hypothetical protein